MKIELIILNFYPSLKIWQKVYLNLEILEL